MSSVSLRRASFYGIPKARCRPSSSFAPTTAVCRKQVDGQSPVSSHIDSSNLDTIFTQGKDSYSAQDASLRTSELLHVAAFRTKIPSCSPTSRIHATHALFSTKASGTLPSSGPHATPSTQTTHTKPFPSPYQHSHPPKPPRSPITNWILSSPVRTDVLLKLGDWLGYGSPKQVAGRRSKIIYTVCSEVAQGPETAFWYDALCLPPSFQSWFTVTNLHVWLATVRLRSLPPSHGRPFVQALVDNFFFDVEDRLRAVLSKKAPERLVTRQMKIFREQWAGLGLACDVALITGDKEMASAMWRNLLGARGAKGIAYTITGPTSRHDSSTSAATFDSSSQPSPKPRDPSSGGVTDFEGLPLLVLLRVDVYLMPLCHTFLGSEIDKYVMYPQLLLVLTSYLRRELVRLEHVSDTTILGGKGQGMRESVFGPEPGTDLAATTVDLKTAFKFGSVKDAARKIGAELENF